MPIFRFDRAFGVGRGVKAFLNLEGGLTRGTPPNKKNRHGGKQEAPKLEAAREQIEMQRRMLESKDREIAAKERKISQLRMLLSAASRPAGSGPKDRPTAPPSVGDSQGGMLPDFLIIGAQKCGTSFLYRLLGRHPQVETASIKEVHYFDLFFGEGVDWYRSNFPSPEHGAITGEASPYYLYHPHAAERAATVIPRAKLIALLRNPIDRAYSSYQHQVRLGNEDITSFEEAIEAEQERLRGEKEKMLADQGYVSLVHQRFSYLSRGVYVDQIREWRKFFAEDQLLVLKSEDFFDRTPETLERVLDFLELPDWQPDPTKLSKPRKKSRYAPMSPETRRRLRDYFEPHNQRLYEFLGTDFGW